ncbi:hypothetical protein GQX73_g2637 [Xylaria multiplex]|uniref:G-patch domain-containing protein n=1 Tax=Xylaria multiplex TaxID=323545 RepID=A0A7C8IWN5_9PEZI|nr:hypothetical protein GQX73_g2637 [Xylaria multiplex]
MYDDYDHRPRDYPRDHSRDHTQDNYRSRSRPPSSKDHHHRSRHGKTPDHRLDVHAATIRFDRADITLPPIEETTTMVTAAAMPMEITGVIPLKTPPITAGTHPTRAHVVTTTGTMVPSNGHDHGHTPRRPASAGSSSPYRSADDGYYRDTSHQHAPGRPYHTLKLDDVPDWLGPQEIDDAMRDMGARGLIEVRIKSDNRVGNRRCYAFAEFKYESDAVDFLERYYPALDMNDRNGTPTRIYIEYSRERRQAPNLDDWKCTLPRHVPCLTPHDLAENAVEMRLDGQSDECPQQTPSQFVVIRGLAPSANETILAAGIKKLYITKEDEPKQSSGMPTKLRSTAPIGNTHGLGAKPGSLIRIFMVRDKLSDISCNYGFAEFSTLDDARAAVAKYNAHPQFTISSKPVTVAFIHSGVFIPYLHPLQEQDRKFTFAATHNPTLRLSYWNPSVYASEHLTFDESLYEEKEQKSGHTTQDLDAQAGKESKKRKADKDLTAPTGKKAIAMAPQLQMWANKHAELHGSKESADGPPSLNEPPLATGPNAMGVTKNTSTTLPSVSYADLDQMCCFLCRRKFKNEPSLRRHEQMSDMHKANLEDEDLITKATQDLMALGKEPTSNYRDRAKERRLAHNQPMKPRLHLPRKAPPTNKDNDSAKEPPPKLAISKGAGLLAKMGWSGGEGLGAEGGGRTDIIETMAYAPGVGLGAEGGKIGDAAQEAARATKNDYADFVSKAKEKARERYEKMG